MRRYFALFSFFLLISISSLSAFAQTPKFSDYPVRRQYTGRPARLNLNSDPLAPTFRTRLRRALASGANFAGRYALAIWGAGSETIRIGIVDVRTGSAHVSSYFRPCGVRFKVSSRLLMIGLPECIAEVRRLETRVEIRTRYFVWTGRQLSEIGDSRLDNKPRNDR
jgi:hypothetical protein